MYHALVALHLVGFALFIACHAVSMWVSFRVRGERDRAVIIALLDLSVRGSRAMYLGLLLLLVGGFGAAAVAGTLLAPWLVVSYVVLVVVFVLMSAIAGFYYHPLREVLAGSDTEPPLDDETLIARLQTRRPELLAAIGIPGLVTLILLMSLKPEFW